MKKEINNQKDYKLRNNISYPNERNLNLEKDSAGFLDSKEENEYSGLFKSFENPGDEEYFEKSEENSFQNNYYLFIFKSSFKCLWTKVVTQIPSKYKYIYIIIINIQFNLKLKVSLKILLNIKLLLLYFKYLFTY